MTAKECITGRQSIRQYTDQPVSHELLAQIVETTSYAPSRKHTQSPAAPKRIAAEDLLSYKKNVEEIFLFDFSMSTVLLAKRH